MLAVRNRRSDGVAVLNERVCYGAAGGFLEGTDQGNEGIRNIYALRVWRNIAASVGEDWIMIMDDQFAPLAENPERSRASLTSLSGLSSTPTIFKRAETKLGNAGSTVIAQDNVRRGWKVAAPPAVEDQLSLNLNQPKAALPVITFEHDVTVPQWEDIRAALSLGTHRWRLDYLFPEEQRGAHGR